MVSTTKIMPVYEVLAQTPEVLVLQTNAGADLSIANVNHGGIASPRTSATVAPNTTSYGRFNLGLHVQDDAKQVLGNRAQLLTLINAQLAQQSPKSLKSQKELKSTAPVEAIYWLNQVHSNQVVRVEADSDLSLTAPAADALISDLPHQALAIMTADCVPIVLYDPNSKQIAAIHAGWQGLANGVISNSYTELTGANNQPQDTAETVSRGEQLSQPMQAWIGTCISQQCYEVSMAVVDKMLAGCAQLGMDTKEVRQQVVAAHEKVDKAWLDLPKLAQLQLQQLGIECQSSHASASEEGLSGAYACSYRDNRYYSYRRQTHLGEDNTGRMAMLIVRLS